MNNRPMVVHACKCKDCTNQRHNQMTFDILCIIRKIFLDPGKKRRCEYFNAKPVKQSVKKWYETTRRPRDIQEIKRDVAKKEMLKARKEGLL